MVEPGAPCLPLVFTDMDGSLLDHFSYAYEPANPALDRLRTLKIPLIPTTSKTKAELEPLRRELGLSGPFVAENGAACLIPKSLFGDPPQNSLDRGDYWMIANSQPRSHWLEMIDHLRQDFRGEFNNFDEVGAAGIMAMTQLSRVDAERANQRQFSEPVQWLGSDDRKAVFVQRLQQLGASVLQGGRFLSVSGFCDKGRALCLLQDLFARQYPAAEVVSLAIGDSNNDISMLERADHALIIRSPVHPPPQLLRKSGVSYSTLAGPAGWNAGVLEWLQQLDLYCGFNPIS